MSLLGMETPVRLATKGRFPWERGFLSKQGRVGYELQNGPRSGG